MNVTSNPETIKNIMTEHYTHLYARKFKNFE